MSSLDKITNSGWGAIFVYFYSAGILMLGSSRGLISVNSGRLIIALYAAIPTAVFVFLTTAFNDELMEFFAGDVIEETFETINERTGDDEFYWDADPDIQESIDEMDEKAHKHLVLVLAGVAIGSSLPFVAYLFYGWLVAGVSLLGGIAVLYLFGIRGFRNLRQVIKSSEKLYGISDED